MILVAAVLGIVGATIAYFNLPYRPGVDPKRIAADALEEQRIQWDKDYPGHIRDASEHWRLGALSQIADDLKPPPLLNRDECVGFEWYFLRHQTELERLVAWEHSGDVSALAFTPDGLHFASAGRDGTILIWDAAAVKVVNTLKGHTLSIHALAFSKDGEKLISVGSGRDPPCPSELFHWDVYKANSYVQWNTDKGMSKLMGVDLSPDEKSVACVNNAGAEEPAIVLFDYPT
jgi:WD40 repeat protein